MTRHETSAYSLLSGVVPWASVVTMDDWDEKEDPYKILELDKGSEVTEAEIKKVYPPDSSLGVSPYTFDSCMYEMS